MEVTNGRKRNRTDADRGSDPFRPYAYQGGQPDLPWEGLKCGTYAGWNDHQRNKEPPCRACKTAQADYMREYRLRTGRTRYRRVLLTAAELALLRGSR